MTDTPTTFEQTHICIILDRSGSMESCRVEAIGSVNAYLADARKDSVLKKADLELTIFDSQSIDTIRSGAPIALADITKDDYQPRGSTPLYDAIGRGIDSLDTSLAKSGSSKAILVVMTDGQENASKRHSHASLSEVIKTRQAKGWLMIFLGAGLENAMQGMSLGVRAGSTASIGTDEQSLRSVSKSMYAMSATYAAVAPMEFMESAQASFSAEARKDMGDPSAGAGLAPQNDCWPRPAGPADPPRTLVTQKPNDDHALEQDAGRRLVELIQPPKIETLKNGPLPIESRATLSRDVTCIITCIIIGRFLSLKSLEYKG